MKNECPETAMLAEYLDGRMDAMPRASVEDHISRCEDCCFTVRESTLAWAESGVDGSSLGLTRWAAREEPGKRRGGQQSCRR